MINIREIKTDPAGQPDQHDLAAIFAIYRHHVLNGTASFEIEPPSSSEMATRMAQLLAGGYPILVAMHHNTLCSYAYAGPHKPRAVYNQTVEDSVYVSDDQRGNGIGRQLLAQLIEAAAPRGYCQMMAVIGDSDNKTPIGVHRAPRFSPHRHGAGDRFQVRAAA